MMPACLIILKELKRKYTVCTPARADKTLVLYSADITLLLLPDPFLGMGAWRRITKPQKPGNPTSPGPEVVNRKRFTNEYLGQKFRSLTE